eukprot:SAG11_NODE_14640_length_605_cov_0.699605_3_plen_30_part_01
MSTPLLQCQAIKEELKPIKEKADQFFNSSV